MLPPGFDDDDDEGDDVDNDFVLEWFASYMQEDQWPQANAVEAKTKPNPSDTMFLKPPFS